MIDRLNKSCAQAKRTSCLLGQRCRGRLWGAERGDRRTLAASSFELAPKKEGASLLARHLRWQVLSEAPWFPLPMGQSVKVLV